MILLSSATAETEGEENAKKGDGSVGKKRTEDWTKRKRI